MKKLRGWRRETRDQEICDAWMEDDGLTQGDLAKTFGVSNALVSRVLVDNGLAETREQKRERHRAILADVDSRPEGDSLMDVAARHGVSKSMVDLLIRRREFGWKPEGS